ncbi:hypothetical protein ACFVVA_41765 [Kitasatospora sp. NPDC058048]|uniref:hypothetical protein n=1 Tax=Kitasatospora sp. NPDC058048 TaxID=3346313 RepID=UPI0036D82F18
MTDTAPAGPLFPKPGEPFPPFTAADALASPAYAEVFAALPAEYHEAAAEYLAAVAGIPDTLSAFSEDDYEEAYLDEDDGPFVGLRRTPAQRREDALQTIGLVNGYLADWQRAVEGLALACYPPCPSDAAIALLEREAGAFYSELVRQRTEQATWFLRDAGLPQAPRPPIEGHSIATSGGYVDVVRHLTLHR